MKPRNLLAALAILLLVQLRGAASGQASGAIEGIVRDGNSGRPLATANVVLVDTEHGAVTGADGRFLLSAISPGKHTIVVSHVGYTSTSREVTLRAGDRSAVVLVLTPEPIRLEGILVATDRARSAASSRTVRDFDLRTRPRRSSQQLLQTVPGLIVAQHAGGGKAEQIFLRGFDNDHGTDVSVSVDGMPVNMVSHGHGHGYADLHFLIPEIVEGIDVHKGPYFAEFGNLANAGQFNTARYTVLYQLPAASHHGHAAYLAGDYYRTDGPFDHPQDLRRLTLFAKVRRAMSPSTRLTMDVGGFSSTWDASGQIPERASRARVDQPLGGHRRRRGGTDVAPQRQSRV